MFFSYSCVHANVGAHSSQRRSARSRPVGVRAVLAHPAESGRPRREVAPSSSPNPSNVLWILPPHVAPRAPCLRQRHRSNGDGGGGGSGSDGGPLSHRRRYPPPLHECPKVRAMNLCYKTGEKEAPPRPPAFPTSGCGHTAVAAGSAERGAQSFFTPPPCASRTSASLPSPTRSALRLASLELHRANIRQHCLQHWKTHFFRFQW